MDTGHRATSLSVLDLPQEFEDLRGLIEADLKAIVGMVASRADERLLLTRREFRQLQADLWNGLSTEVKQALAPLSAEWR